MGKMGRFYLNNQGFPEAVFCDPKNKKNKYGSWLRRNHLKLFIIGWNKYKIKVMEKEEQDIIKEIAQSTGIPEYFLLGDKLNKIKGEENARKNRK